MCFLRYHMCCRPNDSIPDCSCVFFVRIDLESGYQRGVNLLRRMSCMMAGIQAAIIPEDNSSMATKIMGVNPSAPVLVHHRLCK